MNDTIYKQVKINNLKGRGIFTARNVTVQDALNGYAAKRSHWSTEKVIGNIGSITLKK